MADPSLRRAAERIERAGRGLEDSRTLRRALLDEISRTVAFDAYAWLLTDPETYVGSDPQAEVPCLPELPRLIRLKYTTGLNRWTSLTAPVATLHAATGGHLDRSLLWSELLSDYGVVDVASVVFRDRFGCWGFLDLWRSEAGRPFSDADAQYLGIVAPAVAGMLRRCQAATFAAASPAPVPPGPLVLILTSELEVSAETGAADQYLRNLVPTESDRRPVPAGAYNVAAQLLANEASIDAHPPRARVHLGQGAWLSLRAARMAGPRGAAADIAVTIETAAPTERMDLYCRAHGLTPREVEVLAALAKGSDTRQLASELYVSEHTVQDHLKSIFAKTGTANRGSLLARALGAT